MTILKIFDQNNYNMQLSALPDFWGAVFGAMRELSEIKSMHK